MSQRTTFWRRPLSVAPHPIFYVQVLTVCFPGRCQPDLVTQIGSLERRIWLEGTQLAAEVSPTLKEAHPYCYLTRSYIGYLLAEISELGSARG